MDKRTGRRALVTWGQVPLADGERGVSLGPQDLGERARLVVGPADELDGFDRDPHIGHQLEGAGVAGEA